MSFITPGTESNISNWLVIKNVDTLLNDPFWIAWWWQSTQDNEVRTFATYTSMINSWLSEDAICKVIDSFDDPSTETAGIHRTSHYSFDFDTGVFTRIMWDPQTIESVTYQLNSTTFPSDPNPWDQMFVTLTWDQTWDTTEQWIYDWVQWFEIKQTDVIEGTWAELEAIRSASELNVNKTYILTDYKHKYVIENSDSQPTQIVTNVIGNSGSYAQLSPTANHLSVGSVITITALPVWYVWPITIWSTTTATTVFNGWYIIFSPNINQAWFKFSFSSQRYSNVIDNAVLLDWNGRPIIQPWGVINTDVHDGMPYADMSAVENYAVPTERIKLKAIDFDKFSLDVESATFYWDRLRYDFQDTDVKDVNGNIISQRNWFIQWRYNDELDIWMNKDRRVQRYRRYLLIQFHLMNIIM